MSCVLDASAVLAYVHREPGWELVQAQIASACISTVNWSEVTQKIAHRGFDVAVARSLLAELGLEITPFLAAHAEVAADLWQRTHGRGLSLADRACLALAVESGRPVLTADRAWAELGLEVDVRLVR